MNATEQQQRHTAVSRAEKRLAYLETVVDGLAQTMVDDRVAVNRVQKEIADAANVALDAHDARLAAMIADRNRRIAEWEARGFWQRLSWLFLGS